MRFATRTLILVLVAIAYPTGDVIAQQAGEIESMKLLAGDTGWVLKDHRVFWSSDNGQRWRDITPPLGREREVASVFFLDTSAGWALLTHRSEETNDVIGFDLASTQNAGQKWSTEPVRIPNLGPEVSLPGDARLFFLDERLGWINVGSGGSAFNAGFLIATSNGGKTWENKTGADFTGGGRGSVVFTTQKTGWFTNGIQLFVTHDGANRWLKVPLAPPPQVNPAVNPAYDVPLIRDGLLFLPVTYSSPYFPVEHAQSALVLFSSADGGENWRVEGFVGNQEETSAGQALPSTMAGSKWIVSTKTRSGGNTLGVVPKGGNFEPLAQLTGGVLALSFPDALRGWVVNSRSRLLATGDGGITWSDITPGIAHSPLEGLRSSGSDHSVQ